MKSMIAVVMASFVVMSACAKPAEETVETSSEAVSATPSISPLEAVDARAKLALPQVAESLGAGKPAEAYKLDEGFSIRYLDLATLRAYDGKAQVKALATESHDRGYSVLEGAKVVGSLTLHEKDGVWEVSVIGLGAGSSKLSDLRQQLRATRKADGDAYEVVHASALHQRFMVHRENGVEYLTPLKAGAQGTEAAVAVLGRLAEEARSSRADQ